MTRKDYVLIAEAIKQAYVFGGTVTGKDVAISISNALAKENPRFDKLKFAEATGLYKAV